MGVFADDEGSSWAKIACVCLLISFLPFLVSFGAPNWASTNPKFATRNEYIGLWRYCVNPIGGGQKCDNFIDITTGDWLKASQSFMTLAFFGMLACIGLVTVAAFVKDIQSTKILAGAIVATAVTTLFMLIGISVFGGRYHEYFRNKDVTFTERSGQLSWAFGLAVTSLILTASSCVLVVLEAIFGRYN